MLRFLYSATDSKNKKVSGQVDAESAAAARMILESSGHTAIEFFDDEFTARLRMQRAPVPGLDPTTGAALEIKLRTQPGEWPAIVALVKNNLGFLLIDLGLILYGLLRDQWLPTLIGCAGVAFLFGTFIYKRGPVIWYDQILRSMSLGEWDKAIAVMDRLAPRSQSETLLFDLAVRRACIEARRGRKQAALASLEKWRAKMHEPKGMFTGRVATVHYFAGDMPAFVQEMRNAYAEAPDDRTRIIDLALALARFDNVDEAQALLDVLDTDNLPKMHFVFIGWIRGLIALRRGDAENALTELAAASRLMLDSASQPVWWSTMALLNGTLALAIARNGDKAQARHFIQTVLPIFNVYADKSLADLVAAEVLG